MEYIPTIGLEIHVELKTKTKMFCCSENDADETEPNVNICPVCLAHPGTLPVINEEAVRHVLRVGLALKARLADYTEFDRKNYFYPDLPKGYQLSQYEYPLVEGGELHGVAITRVHLEEDTASSIHEEGIGTVIDYNRAGVPLMELVTEPVITSAKQAGDFARELQLLLRYLGASNANMEKGEMRVEANVSVAKDGVRSPNYVELKNINSFNAMERAVRYEIQRQISVLKAGGTIQKETRGWDEKSQTTFSQRIKEDSADYRYFPDPDLPSLKLSEMPGYRFETLSKSMPELPSERRARYVALGVKAQDAESFVRDQRLGGFFESVVYGHENDTSWVALAGNYISNDLVALIRDSGKRDSEDRAEIPISARNFVIIIDMLSAKKISSRVAKDILANTIATAEDPAGYAEANKLFQDTSAGGFEALVRDVLVANPSVVADFNSGKLAALEYLVGQAMKVSRGAADPGAVRELIARLANES